MRRGAVQVPEPLVASHLYYGGEAGRRWCAALPALAQACLERWELRLDGEPGHGAVALVLPVRAADGRPAVLKLQPVDDETRGEATALRCWAGRGAVGLLADDAATGSMLLERLDAARPLLVLPDDLAAVAVVADLLARFTALPAPDGLRQLADVARATQEAVPAALVRAVHPADRDVLGRCAGHPADLLTAPCGPPPLHWDLHYANVLAKPGQPDVWRAIDPKPLAGDPCFELLPALWNRWDDVLATGDPAAAVRRRFDLMTERLGLDRPRAVAWTLVRVLQDACWDLVLFGATALKPAHRAVAEALLAIRTASRP